jgi:glycosyltransferase involved in cell wall biosynthesis
MHILILNWRDHKHPRSGGAEIVTFHHAKGWVEKGHTVTWISSAFRGAKPHEFVEGVQIIRMGNSLSVFFHAMVHYLKNSTRYDIVVDEIHGIPFFTPLYVRKPIVAFIHEVAGPIWDYMYPFPLNSIGRLCEQYFFSLYRNIPFWTDAPSTIADLVTLGIPETHCTAIACPITNKTLRHVPRKEKQPTYVFVSRLVKMKGIEEIIKAFSFINREDKRARLWLVGRGESAYVHKLKQMTKEYGIDKYTSFLGGLPEKDKLLCMKRAHLLLHASIKEGWGLVVIEAASQGTPAVVYDVQGLRDSVRNGSTGIVIPDNHPREMAYQAMLLLSDRSRYRRFQKNAMKWAGSITWKKAINSSLRVLRVAHERHGIS